MSKINEFIEALREDKGYDWIANHGWELSKEDLINIIKEYDYVIHWKTISLEDEDDMYCAVANELEELY